VGAAGASASAVLVLELSDALLLFEPPFDLRLDDFILRERLILLVVRPDGGLDRGSMLLLLLLLLLSLRLRDSAVVSVSPAGSDVPSGVPGCESAEIARFRDDMEVSDSLSSELSSGEAHIAIVCSRSRT
jgi:hypothetical protein